MRDEILHRPPAFGALGGRFMLRDRFDDGVGAIALGEDLVRDAANIRLRDFVDLVELAEEFAPVAVAKLVRSQALCQPLVVAERAQQIDARARLEHGQFLVGHVLGLQLVDLLVDRRAHLLRRMAGKRHGIERKESRDTCAGKPAESLCLGSNPLIAHQLTGKAARRGHSRECR